MALPTCDVFGDCEFQKLSLEQKINHLLVDDGNGCPALKVMTGNDILLVSQQSYRKKDLQIAPQVIKNSTGKVLGWSVINPNAYTIYIKFYDKSTAAVVASDVPVFNLAVPSGGSIYQAPICSQHEFSNGIGISASKDLADLGPTDVATGVMVNVIYS